MPLIDATKITTKVVLILLGLLLVAVAGTMMMTCVQRRAGASIAELKEKLGKAEEREQTAIKERDAFKTQAASNAQESLKWQAQAKAAQVAVKAMEGRMTVLEAKLDALGPAQPVTDPAAMPQEPTALAARLTQEGIEALAQPDGVGIKTEAAQRALALVKDGKEYPKALERAEILTAQVLNLTEQKGSLQTALGAQEHATQEATTAYQREMDATAAAERAGAAAEEQARIQKGLADEAQKKFNAERPKKYFYGGGAVILTALIFLL